jgi:uncharacterized protein (UPF0335 family)
MIDWLFRLFTGRKERLTERVERLDHQNRELRHDLRNIAAKADSLHQLFSKIRDDETWRRPERKR